MQKGQSTYAVGSYPTNLRLAFCLISRILCGLPSVPRLETHRHRAHRFICCPFGSWSAVIPHLKQYDDIPHKSMGIADFPLVGLCTGL